MATILDSGSENDTSSDPYTFSPVFTLVLPTDDPASIPQAKNPTNTPSVNNEDNEDLYTFSPVYTLVLPTNVPAVVAAPLTSLSPVYILPTDIPIRPIDSDDDDEKEEYTMSNRHQTDPDELSVSGIDTYNPTKAPTTSPPTSQNPTILSSDIPSKSPSTLPSKSPSSLPSKGPSRLPSMNPSLKPSSSPSSVPSLPECSVDENGFYGEEAEASTEVNYYYSLELVPSPEEFDDEILSSLESSLSKAILPGIFQDSCGDFTRRIRIRQRALQQTNGITGLSTMPSDLKIDGLLCEGSETDNCFVIDGRMTAYGDNSTEVSNLVREKIRDSMQSGSVNDAHPRIQSVTFLDDISQLPSDDPVILGKGLGGVDNGSRFPIWATAVTASVGALFIIGGAILWQRRRKSSLLNEDANSSAIDTE